MSHPDVKNIHTVPIFLDVYLVGDVDDDATHTKVNNYGLRASKDGAFWVVSGLAAIVDFSQPVTWGCFKNIYTMRYERAKFVNSDVYTFSETGKAGIVHDMDGTMTGFANAFFTGYKTYLAFPDLCWTSPNHKDGFVCAKLDGSLRLHLLELDQVEPWQLEADPVTVVSTAGTDQIDYYVEEFFGWGIPVVAEQVYDLKVDVSNCFTELWLTNSRTRGLLTHLATTPGSCPWHRSISTCI